MVQQRTRKKIVDTLMALTAERGWSDVTLEDIAGRAGVSLAALRAAYDGRAAVLEDFFRMADEQVLEKVDPGLAQEVQRERLFDVLFSRFEVLAPHKQAMRSLMRAAFADPLLAIELNRMATTSMAWMLTAAGIPAAGARGLIRAQAMAIVWARVMRVWLDDDDPGLARTMAALDKRLREAERAAMGINRLERLVGAARRPRSRRDDAKPPEEEGDLAEGRPT